MKKYLNLLKNFLLASYTYIFIFIFFIISIYILVIIYQNVSAIYQEDTQTAAVSENKSLLNLTLYQEIIDKKEAKQLPYKTDAFNNPFIVKL